MNIRTTQQVQDSIKASIRSANSSIALEDGQITKDIVIDAPAVEFRNAYVVSKFVSLIQSVVGIQTIQTDTTFKSDLATALGISSTAVTSATTWTIPSTITNDVDALVYKVLNDLASNYGLTRTVATKSRFLQKFYRTDDNGGAKIQIPLTTYVQTMDVVNKVFITITSSEQYLTYDTTNGLYYVEETVESINTGTNYNVALNSIRQISPIISQAITTSNIEVSAIAQDEETDTSLISRINDVWAGRELNTVTGYKTFCKSFSGVSDAKTVDPSSTFFTRASAGGCDIFVVGRDLVQNTDLFTYVLGTSDYLLQFQPATSIVSVIGSVSGNISFSIIMDTGGYAKSSRAITYVRVSGTIVDGETLSVLYYYDKKIYDIQAALQTNTNKVVAADVLCKYADIAYIDISMDVKTFSAQDPSTDINALLISFINGGTNDGVTYPGYLLGADIEKSDVLNKLTGLSDVDAIDTDTFSIVKRGSGSTADPVVVNENEYARLGNVVINWT